MNIGTAWTGKTELDVLLKVAKAASVFLMGNSL